MLRLFKGSKHFKIYENIENDKMLADKDKISISESFQRYVKEIIPKYEVQVETSILRNLYSQLKDPVLKKHLINVYKRRELHLVYKAYQPDITVLPIRPSDKLPPDHIDHLGSDISKVTCLDIGKIYTFPLSQFFKYFPKVNYGHLEYVDQYMTHSKSFSFQMSPEAFSTIEILRWQETLRHRTFESFKMNKLFGHAVNKSDLEIILSDHEIFLKLIFTFGDCFQEILWSKRFTENFTNLFGNSFMTDYISMILIWNLNRSDVRELILHSSNRKRVFEAIIDEIMSHQNVKFFLPYKIESWLENQQTMNLSETVKIDLLAQNGMFKKLPQNLRHFLFPNFIGFNSNLLFWGVHGSGKSGLLYAVTMWAIKSKWLVVKVPSVKAITWSKVENLIRHEKSRLWMAPVLAKALIEDLINTNKEILKSIPVNLDTYGFYSIVGVHDKEENPVPNFYIEDRQTYFYESDKFRSEEEMTLMAREQEHLNVRLKDKLAQPKNLLEIAEFGFKNENFCTNCLAEILEQVYNTDKASVLVVIDDFNWFFRPTNNPAFYYFNVKSLSGQVPPYHVALCRLFMRFDGHLIKNGFKLAGTSNFSIARHLFEPHKINFPEEFCQKLEGMQLKDVENFLAYCYENGLDKEPDRNWEYYMSIWTETQGNYERMLKLTKYPDFRGLDG